MSSSQAGFDVQNYASYTDHNRDLSYDFESTSLSRKLDIKLDNFSEVRPMMQCNRPPRYIGDVMKEGCVVNLSNPRHSSLVRTYTRQKSKNSSPDVTTMFFFSDDCMVTVSLVVVVPHKYPYS